MHGSNPIPRPHRRGPIEESLPKETTMSIHEKAMDAPPRESPSSSIEGALVRVGASTAGGAAVGGAVAMLLGLATGGGAMVGGGIGLAAAIADNLRSRDGR